MIRTVTYLIPLLAGLVLGAAILYGINQHNKIYRLQELSLPVTTDMRIVGQVATWDGTYIHVVGVKARDCGPPIAVRAAYGVALDKISNVTFLNDVDGETIRTPYERKVGEHDFGWWRLRPPIKEDPLVIYVYHECDGVMVRTVIGPFNIVK